MNSENFLLIDASSPLSVCAGILGENGRAWKSFAEEKSAALEGVFSAIKKVSAETPEPAGFLFCEGPGSILGIRIAAAAIRARLALDRSRSIPARRVFAFQSLHLAAHLILRAFPQTENFVVAAESRMNAWNILHVKNGVPAERFEEIKTSETANFSGEKIFLLPCRRALPPAFADAVPCSVFELLKNDPAVFADVPALLRNCADAPDATNTSDVNSYARWTPGRHRAESAQGAQLGIRN